MARFRLVLACFLSPLAFACSDAAEPTFDAALAKTDPNAAIEKKTRANVSLDAKAEIATELYEDATHPRHPGDGGGRAWLVALRARISIVDEGGDGFGPPVASVRSGSRARIRIGFEVGEEGIDEGGAVYLQNSPFWDWEPAQASEPNYGGYTAVVAGPDDVEFEAQTYGGGLVQFTVRGRRLEAGERLELEYGAGDAGTIVDRLADREARVWLHVDADGDSIRSAVASSPFIETHAGRPTILVLRTPTTARPGELLEMRVSVLDSQGNARIPFEGRVSIEAQEGLEFPDYVDFRREDLGSIGVPLRARRTGFFRIRATTTTNFSGITHELAGETEPLLVHSSAPRIRWADLHGHSSLSDGTGTPEDFFRYARDVSALDVVSLTDHDHWGMRALDAHPAMWDRIQEATKRANEPGRFVSLLGYEWTSWLHGHRHVIQFADSGPLFSSIDRERRYETPAQLWAALRGLPALTFAHHSAGGPISTNWNYPPDPELEPVTEVVSVHGSSEAPDSPRAIYSPVPGNYVRDVLDRGFVLGMIGSGDSHDGHPGLSNIASPSGGNGIAAIFSEDLSREGVLEALRARRVYATNGPRIFLRTLLDGEHEMGARVEAMDSASDDSATHLLTIRVGATAPLKRVDVIRSGEIVMTIAGEGLTEWARNGDIPHLRSGEYLYVRAIQEDGGTAWSSPYFGPARNAEAGGNASNADSD
ncbi:MAG: CehA/McbA family metallohydrolase [Myxococcota bacterium]|nr:CehA/McbA family metallohydrolase [Myxococcota bacterium]